MSYYIDTIRSYTQREKIKNDFTGLYEEPNEHFLRIIEAEMDIPESRKDDFRREIMVFIGSAKTDNRPVVFGQLPRFETFLRKMTLKSDLHFLGSSSYNFPVELWRKPSNITTKVESGIFVNNIVLFPGLSKIQIHDIIIEICELYYNPKMLQLLRDLPDTNIRQRLIEAFKKGSGRKSIQKKI